MFSGLWNLSSNLLGNVTETQNRNVEFSGLALSIPWADGRFGPDCCRPRFRSSGSK